MGKLSAKIRLHLGPGPDVRRVGAVCLDATFELEPVRFGQWNRVLAVHDAIPERLDVGELVRDREVVESGRRVRELVRHGEQLTTRLARGSQPRPTSMSDQFRARQLRW
jgi:hypothetical protein